MILIAESNGRRPSGSSPGTGSGLGGCHRGSCQWGVGGLARAPASRPLCARMHGTCCSSLVVVHPTLRPRRHSARPSVASPPSRLPAPSSPPTPRQAGTRIRLRLPSASSPAPRHPAPRAPASTATTRSRRSAVTRQRACRRTLLAPAACGRRLPWTRCLPTWCRVQR